MTEFYERLGFTFTKQFVKNGGYFYRAQFNGMELVIYKSTGAKWNPANFMIPKLQVSIVVVGLDQVLKSLKEIRFIPAMDPTEMDGALRAIVIDPEGHSVELIENVNEAFSAA